MNLSLITHVLRILDARRGTCKRYKGGTATKDIFDSPEDALDFIHAHASKWTSDWKGHIPTAIYACPNCNGWHITTSEFDPEKTKKWQLHDYNECKQFGKPLNNIPQDPNDWYRLITPEDLTQTYKGASKDQRTLGEKLESIFTNRLHCEYDMPEDFEQGGVATAILTTPSQYDTFRHIIKKLPFIWREHVTNEKALIAIKKKYL